LPRIGLAAAGTALGVVLLVVLLNNVKLDQLQADIAGADVGLLALAFVFYTVNLLIKVPRAALLYGDDAPSWDTLFGAINIGYGLNAVLPARLGEVARAYWIRERAQISMVRSLSTIALERVIDGVAVLILLLAMVPTVAVPAKLLGPALTVGVAFIAALVGMVVLAHQSTGENNLVSALVARLEGGRWSAIGVAIRHVIIGLQVLRSRRAVLLLALYTGITWGSNIFFGWFVLRALHIGVPLTAGALLIATLNLGMSVPSTPGYVGVFEGLAVLTLNLYNVPKTQALAAALVLHVMAFAPSTVIALFYLSRAGFQSTLQLVRASAAPKSQSSPPQGDRGDMATLSDQPTPRPSSQLES
jgi:uncharacterized protein (TIRG00374 family)